jgi:redox-sensitive bicupin YhaK (pirin superfamily)
MDRKPSDPFRAGEEAVDIVLLPRTADLGDGLTVHRALPASERRLVGPFIFFDRIGPALLRPGSGLDVRPHPHIGLATVTYLFEGEILHRDSLGSIQPIRPGEVNWMTAGKGIVHSERTPIGLRAGGGALSGIQTWVALPGPYEETAPAFVHHEAAELPVLEDEGKRVRLIAGSLYGARSPVQTLSEMFYAEVTLDPGASLPLPVEHEERAAYLLEGAVELVPSGGRFEPGRLVVFRPGSVITLRAEQAGARLMLLGGEAMDGPRHIWWNFVSSSRERIEQAKQDWRAGRYGSVPGDPEFIPLPEERPPEVTYP